MPGRAALDRGDRRRGRVVDVDEGPDAGRRRPRSGSVASGSSRASLRLRPIDVPGSVEPAVPQRDALDVGRLGEGLARRAGSRRVSARTLAGGSVSIGSVLGLDRAARARVHPRARSSARRTGERPRRERPRADGPCPSVRSRFVVDELLDPASEGRSCPGSSVSSCTTTSGERRRDRILHRRPRRARRARRARRPAARSRSVFAGVRVVPTTSWPRWTSCGHEARTDRAGRTCDEDLHVRPPSDRLPL